MTQAEKQVTITLPDGKTFKVHKGTSVLDAVKVNIGEGLARAALAAKVNDAQVDLDFKLEKDATLTVLTFNDKDGKEVFRHSTAHVFALAIQELYPQAKNTIGPAVEEGFYYDFDDLNIKPEDFEKIEKKMAEIVKQDFNCTRVELTLEEAKRIFKDNPYKLEMAQEFSLGGNKLSAYKIGDKFIDMCRGPHVPSTGYIKAFKLTKIAGAYWRGDAKNKQLTRIYGISFPKAKELEDHLKLLEELEKRDHRKIGREQGLFLFSELVGGGLPLWTPKGTILRTLLDEFVWELRKQRGYQKVTIPHITKKDLYVTSGHWAKYADDLFKVKTREGHEFAMKPMNCPHHTQIYGYKKRSYRELPQRYAETTMVYRDEQSGELSGLSRVLCITQDDAHVFCRESQVKEEAYKIWDIINTFYGAFGFHLKVRLSLHDPTKFEKYVGTKEKWVMAEDQLRDWVKERKVEAVEARGEAAFYGPKLDFMAQDCLGRQWQVATLQVDRSMPERFNLFCINEKGEEERIVMIHAAIMGSIERFTSVLIEHLAGKFPLWLSPVQAKVLTIVDRVQPFAEEVIKKLQDAGIRAEADFDPATLNKKVRDAQLEQVPYILVIGEKEAEKKTVNVRTRDEKVHGDMPVDELIIKLKEEITSKRLK
ncbi:MAG TPA: threonine--tRNA ligase [Candidatus Nanoarchaeia archaeon]|nr:threonine--tRNA ligase [Candidatus Nanoarchaeia archaeon]